MTLRGETGPTGRLLLTFFGAGKVVAVEVTAGDSVLPLSFAVEPEEVCDCGSSNTEEIGEKSSSSSALPALRLSVGEEGTKSGKARLLHLGNIAARSRA